MQLNARAVRRISQDKNEPEWMFRLRLNALKIFSRMPLPKWQVPDLSEIDFDAISYYSPQKPAARRWEDVPKSIRAVYEKMGIPKAEQEMLAGTVAQYQSSGVYENLKRQWESKGVIFCSLDEALKRYPTLVRRYFTSVVPIYDNKFSALHYAVWSGGSFLYVPKGVDVSLPVQTYFYMKDKREGQFEHTLIIAEENSRAHYIEGCTAPVYDEHSLHSAVVEVVAKKHSSVRYTTVQNWSKNIYNLNTKRARVGEGALMEWVGGSLGAKVSMLYPASVLEGKGARASHITLTLAPAGTVKESGAKVIHAAPDTRSTIISKGISMGDGRSVYRGLVKVLKGAKNSQCTVKCDSLLLDAHSKSETYPYSDIRETEGVVFTHEASAGRVSEEQLSYMMSRGISEQDARMLFVTGFIKPVLNEVPLEYMVELTRFIHLEMENSVG
ncbi:MAG: Fe-S cluster assembly protein SufB [Candidatus Micrarchaeia archaeon]